MISLVTDLLTSEFIMYDLVQFILFSYSLGLEGGMVY